MPARYDEDFYAWTQETAKALAEGRVADVDLEHVAEELRDLGTSQKRELEHRLMRFLMHLLECRYRPEERTRTWDRKIGDQRSELRSLFKYNPSLKSQVSELISDTYNEARLRASLETELPLAVFPVECPFTTTEILGEQLAG